MRGAAVVLRSLPENTQKVFKLLAGKQLDSQVKAFYPTKPRRTRVGD